MNRQILITIPRKQYFTAWGKVVKAKFIFGHTSLFNAQQKAVVSIYWTGERISLMQTEQQVHKRNVHWTCNTCVRYKRPI